MKNLHRMRSGFSMITAIFVIVIMATIGAFVMNLSGKIVKTTTAQYQHEQAILYAKSYTEYAVMAIQAHDRAANCLTTITGNIGDIDQGGYDINASLQYIGTPVALGSCDDHNYRLNVTNVATPNTPLTVIVDVYVNYKDPDNTAQILTVHRRTVQKI